MEPCENPILMPAIRHATNPHDGVRPRVQSPCVPHLIFPRHLRPLTIPVLVPSSFCMRQRKQLSGNSVHLELSTFAVGPSWSSETFSESVTGLLKMMVKRCGLPRPICLPLAYQLARQHLPLHNLLNCQVGNRSSHRGLCRERNGLPKWQSTARPVKHLTWCSILEASSYRSDEFARPVTN